MTLKTLITNLFTSRKKIAALSVMVLWVLFPMESIAQPAVLYTNLSLTTPASVNNRWTLTDLGVFRQYRFQANQLGDFYWAFSLGTPTAWDYNENWRPTTSGNVMSYNTFIPAGWDNGAKYNISNFGADGEIKNIQNNYYYTFNVFENTNANNSMEVLETNYSPALISSLTSAWSTYGKQIVTIVFTTTPQTNGENVFLRYTTGGINFPSSQTIQFTMAGNTGTAIIPAVAPGSSVYFYAYTSPKTKAAIDTDVTTYGQPAHDMASLVISGVPQNYSMPNSPIVVTSTAGTAAGVATGYTTLQFAFSAINGGAIHLGAITIAVLADSPETGTATLNQLAGVTSVGMQPAGGSARTISGNIIGALIDINGADYVTIDGREGGSGSSTDLTISNTSTISGASTIKFETDATSNLITYCNVLGSFTGSEATAGGTIWIASNSSLTGNDNNSVSFCNIGPFGTNWPAKAIYFTGTPSFPNNSNTITDNNIFDYFNATAGSAGIYVGNGTTDCNFTANRFYQTTPRTQTTGAQHSAIWIANSSGNNFQITGNTIGYSDASGAGMYSLVGVDNTKFLPIYLNVGNTTATSLQSNTITNIAFSSSGAATSEFTGIYAAAGAVNIGTIAGNIIGAATGTGSVSITNNASAATDVYGIRYAGSVTGTIQNNTISSISTTSTTVYPANFCGIYKSGNGTATIIGNLVGSLTTAESINTGVVSISGVSTIYGIYNSGSGDVTLSGNTIANMANLYTGSGQGSVVGIYSGGSGISMITKNFIRSLASANTDHELYGIKSTTGSSTFANNIISLGTGMATGCNIFGFYDNSASSASIYFNTIYIGGAVSGGSNLTYAFSNGGNTTTHNILNNIFTTARTGTGTHYAINIPTNTGITIDYNNYYSNSSGLLGGRFNTNPITTLSAWSALTGQDAHSKSINPNLTSAGGINATDYKPTAVNLPGISGTGINDDYSNAARNSVPAMGAWELACQVAFDTDPISHSTCDGSNTSFSISASGTETISYQWQENTGTGFSDIINGGIYSNATTATLNLTGVILGMSGYQYRCIASLGCGSQAMSDVGILTVIPLPIAPTGSAIQSFCSVTSPTVANLAATGTAIKWYNAATAGTQYLGTDALANGTHYYASQTENGCESSTRLDVTVTITPTPAAPTGSSSQTFCENTNPTIASLSATGNNIQWYAAASGGSVLATSTTLVNGTHYFASQTVSGCESTARFDVTAIVNPNASVGSVAGTSTLCAGVTAIYVANSVVLGGGTGAWSSSNSGVATVNSSGQVAVVGPGISNIIYKITDGCGGTDSAYQALTVNASPNPPTGDATQYFCSSPTPTVALLSATGTSVQWYLNPTGGSPLASITDLQTGTHNYYASQTVGSCESASRLPVTVTRINTANVSAITGPASSCPASSLTYSVTPVTGTTYKWSIPGGWSASSSLSGLGVSAINVTSGAFGNVGDIKVVAVNACGSDSTTLAVTVISPPEDSISSNYCTEGGVKLTAHPGPADYSYQWTQNGTNYSTSQFITVNIAAIYSVKVTNTITGCFASATTSLSTELVKNGKFDNGNDSTFFSDYLYQPYLPGDSSLQRPEGKYAIGTDPQAYHKYFWGRDHTTNTGNFMIINGIPSSVAWRQQITGLVPGTKYYFSAWAISLNNSTPFAQLQFRINGVQVGSVVTLPGRPQLDNPPYNWLQFYGDWTATDTTSALLEIIDLQTSPVGNDFGLDDISFGTLSPTLMSLAASANGGDPVCEGGTVDLSVSINGGRPPYTFAWTGPNGTSIPAVQYPSISNVTTADNGTYTVVINDSYGCTAVSASTTVSVLPTPTAAIVQEGVKVSACKGSDPPPAVTFTGAADAAPYTFTYHINNGADTTTTSDSTNNSKSITFPTSASGDFTYTLTKVKGASGCSQLQTSAKTISIKEVTATISGSTGVCYGATQPEITFTGSGWGSAPPFTFTYNINGRPDTTAVANAENCISIPVPTNVTGTFVYTLDSVTASGCTQPANGSATITVSPSPIIIGLSSLCINASNITYSTEAGMTGYTWNITGGTIASGQSTYSVTVNWGAIAGAQSISVTYTNNSCTVTTPLQVTLNAYPAITTAASTADVCFSAADQTTTLPYSIPTGSPTTYSITWNASPANSFAAVTDAALSASPINITVPAGTAPGTYTGTITVNNVNGCVSNGTTFTVTVNALPTTSAIYHQ